MPSDSIPKKTATSEATSTPQRLLSLDAYCGLIMITLAFFGFGLARTLKTHLGDELFLLGGTLNKPFFMPNSQPCVSG